MDSDSDWDLEDISLPQGVCLEDLQNYDEYLAEINQVIFFVLGFILVLSFTQMISFCFKGVFILQMLNRQEEEEEECSSPSPKKIHLDQEGAGVVTRRMKQQQQQQQDPQPSTSSDRTALISPDDSEEEELLPQHHQSSSDEASDGEDFFIERPLPQHRFFVEHLKTRSFKHRGAVDEVTYRAKLKHPSSTTDLNTLSVELKALFSSILIEIRRNYKPHSLMRVFITHPDLEGKIVIYPNYIEQMTVEDIMYEIDRRLKSAGFIPADS